MASGRLGASAPSASTDTGIYTVPVGRVATFNVSITNTNTSPVTIRLSLSSSVTPQAGEYIMYEYALPANTTIERTGIVLDAGKVVVGRASTTGVNFVVYGLED